MSKSLSPAMSKSLSLKEGSWTPKQIAPLALWKRVLYSLPSWFVFCCYTLTSYPIVKYILQPALRFSSVLGVSCSVVYVSLLVAVLFCWLRLALGVSVAGDVPEQWRTRAAQGQICRRDYTMCSRCEAPRPLRARHCGQCGRCVLAFDHHCPWTGCCVGWGNKKAFIQYLFVTTMFTGFCCWLAVYKTLVVGPVVAEYSRLVSSCMAQRGFLSCVGEVVHEAARWGTGLAELQVFIVFILAGAFSLGTIVLGVYHVGLAGRNLTTMEDGSFSINEFRLPRVSDNLRQIFGDNLLLGFFSPANTTPGDGTNFPRPHLMKTKDE